MSKMAYGLWMMSLA